MCVGVLVCRNREGVLLILMDIVDQWKRFELLVSIKEAELKLE